MIPGRIHHWQGMLFLVGFLLVACSGGTSDSGQTRGGSASCEGVAIGNPSAVYCSLLGYDFTIQDTGAGQAGFCNFPDGSSCESWDFLRGKCGQEKSWCTLNGLGIRSMTEDDGSAVMEYVVCIDSNQTIVGKVTDLSGLQALLDACNQD